MHGPTVVSQSLVLRVQRTPHPGRPIRRDPATRSAELGSTGPRTSETGPGLPRPNHRVHGSRGSRSIDSCCCVRGVVRNFSVPHASNTLFTWDLLFGTSESTTCLTVYCPIESCASLHSTIFIPHHLVAIGLCPLLRSVFT